MCRIVGGFELVQKSLHHDIVRMRDCMRSGGEDGSGLFVDGRLALAHRRLAIIDLDGSSQPYENERYVLVFNGEIYNYKQIQKELRQEGIKAPMSGDVGVLLEAFGHWGLDGVLRFDGMFAFAIYDKQTKELTLVRDRFGAKPLYYYCDENCFLFSSELKGLFGYSHLQKSIHQMALDLFFEFGYIPAPFCILQQAHKLEAGCYLRVCVKTKQIQKGRYFSPIQSYDFKPYDKEAFVSALEESICARMVSDVGVGVALSGGVDSSLVCATLKHKGYDFESFCVGFVDEQGQKNSFDESLWACRVAKALGIPHHTILCSPKELFDLLPSLPFVYDEPFGDSSNLPTLILAKAIKSHYKVALSADGGDELSLGYDRYFWAYERYHSYKKFKIFQWLLRWVLGCKKEHLGFLDWFGISYDRFVRVGRQLGSKSFLEHYLVEISHLRGPVLKEFGREWERRLESLGDDCFGLMSAFDVCHYLSEDILTKTDRAGMSVGLEFREPLLGRGITQTLMSFDRMVHLNAAKSQGKMLLKSHLENFLPKELIYRKKMGFGCDVERLFFANKQLLDEIDAKEWVWTKGLIADFLAQRRVDFAKIWYAYILSTWKRAWNIQ